MFRQFCAMRNNNRALAVSVHVSHETLRQLRIPMHAMCVYAGHLYYADAGIAPGGVSNGSPWAGFVCRID